MYDSSITTNPEIPDAKSSETDLIVTVEQTVPMERYPGLMRRMASKLTHVVGRCLYHLTALASVVLFLALIAAIPGLNIYALGFLIQAEGAVAREGKLRFGFPLYHRIRKLGMLALGCWVCLLPLRILGDISSDARLINPDSATTQILQIALLLLTVLMTIHLFLAVMREGSFLRFVRPIKNYRNFRQEWREGDYFHRKGNAVLAELKSYQILAHFRTGIISIVGVLMWTLIPTLLFATATSTQGPAIIATILGGLLLAYVMSWVPILQTHYSAEQQFSAYREWSTARQIFRKCPLLWTIMYLLGFTITILLYLFKIVSPPQDALWMLTLFFIMSIYPIRLGFGWVYARTQRLDKEPHWLWRKFWSLICLLLCGVYVFLLFFMRDISERGQQALFEQPLLLLPTPF